MMTFSPRDIAHFLRANSRSGQPALIALAELESRNITGAATVRKATATALCQSAADKEHKKLNELTAGEAGWLLWPFPLYPSERV